MLQFVDFEVGEMPFSDERAQRIEDQLKELTAAIQKLILIDERQMRQGERLGSLEDRVGDLQGQILTLKAQLDKWVWFGTGAWSVLTILFVVAQAVMVFLVKR